MAQYFFIFLRMGWHKWTCWWGFC